MTTAAGSTPTHPDPFSLPTSLDRMMQIPVRLAGAGMALYGLLSLLAARLGYPASASAPLWMGCGCATGLWLLGTALGLRHLQPRVSLASAGAALVWVLAVLGWGPLHVAGMVAAWAPPLLLMMVVAAMFLLGHFRQGRSWAAGLALSTVFVVLLVLIAQLVAAPQPPWGAGGRILSPTMALCFLLLSLGWLVSEPRRRPMAFLFEGGSAGWLMRRLLPLLLAFPYVAAWIGAEQNRRDPATAWTWAVVFVLASFIVLLTLLWRAATALDRLDTSRSDLQAYVREVGDLYDHAPCGYHSLDAQGRFVNINATELGWLGYRREEVVGKLAITDLLTPAGLEVFNRTFPVLRQTGEMQEVEAELRRKDGSVLPVIVNATAIRDAKGRFLRSRSSVFDITARRRLEEQNRQSQKLRAIGRLAAGVAHDFNNLLTIINGYTDMILEEQPAPGLAEKARSVRQAGERAAVLTHQLLAFSRQQILQPRVLDLNAMVAEMEPLLRRTLGEDIELSSRLAPDLLPVKADPSQMDQVLMNLVINARDAIPTGQIGTVGRIHIETANVRLDEEFVRTQAGLAAGEYVMLAVCDTGCGMRLETMANIFEPFFTTKPKGKGTGLGLPTVFGIARQSGGTVVADSVWGQGTTMRVYLPALRAEVAEAAPDPQSRMATNPGAKETILVVEDEAELRAMLLQVLAPHGYHLLAAANPGEALELSRGHAGPLDLLLTDVVMPGMNGTALAAQLEAERPGLRVLFISGYADQALPAGHFLAKPFAPQALAQKVRTVLDAPPPARAANA